MFLVGRAGCGRYMAVAVVMMAVARGIRRAAMLAVPRIGDRRGARCRARRCGRAVAMMVVAVMVVAVARLMLMAVRAAMVAMPGVVRRLRGCLMRRARFGDLHQLRRRLVCAVAALAVLAAAARRPWARASVRFRIVWQTFVGHRRLHLRGSCPLYRASPYRKVKLCVFAP